MFAMNRGPSSNVFYDIDYVRPALEPPFFASVLSLKGFTGLQTAVLLEEIAAGNNKQLPLELLVRHRFRLERMVAKYGSLEHVLNNPGMLKSSELISLIRCVD